MPKSVWDEIRAGKLDEGRDILAELLFGGHARGREVYLQFRAGPYPKARSAKVYGGASERTGERVFLRFDYVRQPRVPSKLPRSVLAGKRDAVWPIPSEVAMARREGAKREGRGRVWTIPKGTASPELAALVGPAGQSRMLRIANRRAVRPGAVGKYQKYIDGVGASKTSKAAARIEVVDGVPSLLGNFGTEPTQRAAFWVVFESTLEGQARRTQYRILLYLPSFFTPAERRAAVELFAARVLEPLGIRWAAAIHRPMPDTEGEEGTHHAHIVFAPMEPARMRTLLEQDDRAYLQARWRKKDAEGDATPEPSWLERTKEIAAEVFNEVYWKTKRRNGLAQGTPIFFVGKRMFSPPRDTAYERRLWRADKKREQVGLPTLAQRRRIAERTNIPEWMSLEPLLPSLEAAVQLWLALIPKRRQHEPQVARALVHLRNWAEELLESFRAELDEAFEVATYLALPLRARRSELMDAALDRFQQIGPGHLKTRGHSLYNTAYDELRAKARQGEKLAGQLGREYADTVKAIEAVEGRRLEDVTRERTNLGGYHALLIKTLQGRAHIFTEMEATIRRLEALRLEDLAHLNDPGTNMLATVVDLAANGCGATLPMPGRDSYFHDGGLARPFLVRHDESVTLKAHIRGFDDPWLRELSEKEAEVFPRLWKEARSRLRRAMFERNADMRQLVQRRDVAEVQPAPLVREAPQRANPSSDQRPKVPMSEVARATPKSEQAAIGDSQVERKERSAAEVVRARQMQKHRPGQEH